MFVFCQRPILVLETDRKYAQLLETKGPNESFHSKFFIVKLKVSTGIWKWIKRDCNKILVAKITNNWINKFMSHILWDNCNP